MITRLLNPAKNYCKKISNIITLQPLKNVMNKKCFIRVGLSNILNIINAIVKILSPATFGKAIEMMAKSEIINDDFGVEITATHLLYLSAVFTSWTLVEGYIRKSLLFETENAFIKDLSLQLTQKSHEVSITDQLHLRNDIMGGYFSIQNKCSNLSQEVVNSFYPSIIDIVLGVGVVSHKFGRSIGTGFLFYVLFDLFIYNNLIMAYAKSGKNSEKQNLRLNELIDHEYETLSHVETVRMNNREMFELAVSRKKLVSFLNAKTKLMKHDFIYNILSKIPQLVATFMLVNRISQNVTIDDIDESIFLLTYFSLFSSSVDNCNYSLKMIFNIIEAIEKLNEIHNKESECHLTVSEGLLTRQPSDSKPIAIKFQNVTFGYAKDKPVIKNLNLSIKPGMKVAIVGQSGSGKSTLAKLLLKFHQPTSGVIKINGVDINGIPASILRAQIGYVNQSPELFAKESLQYNLAYGMPNHPLTPLKNRTKTKITKPFTDYHSFDLLPDKKSESDFDATCKSLLQQVGLEEHIHRMGESNGATALSGGQKQQVVFARALANNPRLLICDEPTSALDSFSEANLLACFFKTASAQTILMIAHRLSTIKEMDEIIVLSKGEVVEQGTHNELMEKKQHYFNYWQLQSNKMKPSGRTAIALH